MRKESVLKGWIGACLRFSSGCLVASSVELGIFVCNLCLLASCVERTSVEQHQVSARVADWVGWAKLCLGIFL